MAVRMELTRIVDCDLNDHHWIHLSETHGERTFPIVIGRAEAQIINRRLLEDEPFRPLTHQLLWNVAEVLGGTIEDVVITELREHTYYAVIRIRCGDELHEVDCRPSDGIALAAHARPMLPIYVEESVLQAVVGS